MNPDMDKIALLNETAKSLVDQRHGGLKTRKVKDQALISVSGVKDKDESRHFLT